MKFNKNTIDNLELNGKKVLIRVDFNVPIDKGVITSNKRIVEAIPTIKKVIEDGGKAIVFSHLGRVKSEEDKAKQDIKIVATELERLLGKEVKFINETRGSELENAIQNLENGEVLMFQNTRWEDADGQKESKNDPELGKYWASLGDVFINDAFGAAHRAHASNVGIATNISESAVGYLMEKEVTMLSKALYDSKKPIVSIIGGAKVSDKIKVIENLLKISDYVLVGGGMAYTFNKAKGIEIGTSLCQDEFLEVAKDLMAKGGEKLVLPTDWLVTAEFKDTPGTIATAENFPSDKMGLDIGPESVENFVKILENAKTVIWNGPMGVSEFENYKNGTESIAKAIVNIPDVFSLIGGGDSAAAAIKLGFEKQFTHISTGGGASLEFMEGTDLPGISCIQECNCECGEH